MPEWWETYFDEDYFRIYSFSEERTKTEVDFVLNALALTPGDRLLDLCCGHGRHSLELAKRGIKVTGQDLSQVFLERARRDAGEQGVEVEFVRSDMREIPFANEFDAVINLFTAFGYFDRDSEDERVFAAVASALRPRGQFLIDVQNPLRLARVFQPRDWLRTEPEGALLLEDREWDYMTGRTRNVRTLITKEGERRDEFTIRLYTLPEMRTMAERVGLSAVTAYGGFDSSPYSHTSGRLVFVARKPEVPA